MQRMILKKQKRITIDNEAYVVSELTIRDIFNLSGAINETGQVDVEKLFNDLLEDASLIVSVINCPLSKILQMPPSDIQQVYNSFLDINKLLFKQSSPSGKISQKPFILSLFKIYCRLIEIGHKDAFDYGYSFGLEALGNYRINRLAEMAETSTSIRQAYHSDAKEWKRYIRGLIR